MRGHLYDGEEVRHPARGEQRVELGGDQVVDQDVEAVAHQPAQRRGQPQPGAAVRRQQPRHGVQQQVVQA